MRRALLSAFLVAALALCSLAQSAGGAYDPLGSATTTLVLAKPFASFLRQNKIAVKAVAPAKVKGKKLTLPLAEGKWDPTTGKGQVESAGAIVFQSAKRKLPFKDLLVKANRVPLTAKVGGGKLKVAASKQISSKRAGFGSAFTATALKLSAKAATRLNKKLRPEVPFEANQLLGTLTANSQPQTMSVLAQNRLTLALSPELIAKLNSLFVSLNPVAPAELAPGPLLSSPIAPASTISPDGAQGTIRTEGEAELLQLGAGQLFWGEQWLDLSAGADLITANLQPSPPYAGKQAQGPLFSLSLAGAQVTPDPQARTVSVANAALALTQTAADQMNQLFAQGKGVFKAGEALGTLSFVAQGQ